MTHKKPIHIIEIPSWFPPIGGLFSVEQSIALKKHGLRVEILTNIRLPWKDYGTNFSKYPMKLKKIDVQGVVVYQYFSRGIPKLVNLNIKRWISKTVQLVEQYIELEGKPDLIHAHSWMYAGCVASIIKKKHNIPYVLTEHWDAFSMKSDYAKKQFTEERKPLIREAISNADFIVTVSEEVIAGIQKYANSQVKIKAISNIVDTDFYHIPTTRKKNSKFTFVCTNDFKEMKGYDILIDAINILKDNGFDFIVRIAGEFFDTKEWNKLFDTCRHKKSIILEGILNKEGVRDLLWSGDAFCLPSRSESQSISTLEALSTGLPIICTDVVPQKIRVPQVGYSIEIEAPNQLAKAMQEMIINRCDFDSVAISNHVKSIASAEVVSAQLVQVFSEVLTADINAQRD